MTDPWLQDDGFRRVGATDAVIEALAAAHGWVTDDRELRAAGVPPGVVRRRIASGRLRELWPGTYQLGSRPPTWQGRFRAAARSYGAASLVCRRSAAIALGLASGSPARIDVLVSGTREERAGIRLHRGRLRPGEVEEVDGVPVTTLARTAIDLAADGARRDVERLLRAAEQQRMDASAVRVVAMERRPGAPLLRAVLADLAPDGTTASDFEEEVRDWLRDRGLRGAVHNHPVIANGRRYVLDVFFARARLALELDPFSTHGTPEAFERDRRKDSDLLLESISVVRVTPRRLRREGADLHRTLGRLLASRVPSSR